MVFHSKGCKSPVADLYLPHSNLLYLLNSNKYLGVILEDGNCDKDVTQQLKRFHINANLWFRKFGKCSFNTKLELIGSYSTNVYCGILWHDATKKRVLPNCVSHTILSHISLVFHIIAVNMFVSCEILTKPKITRKMTRGYIEKLRWCSNVFRFYWKVKTVQQCVYQWYYGLCFGAPVGALGCIAPQCGNI